MGPWRAQRTLAHAFKDRADKVPVLNDDWSNWSRRPSGSLKRPLTTLTTFGTCATDPGRAPRASQGLERSLLRSLSGAGMARATSRKDPGRVSLALAGPGMLGQARVLILSHGGGTRPRHLLLLQQVLFHGHLLHNPKLLHQLLFHRHLLHNLELLHQLLFRRHLLNIRHLQQ